MYNFIRPQTGSAPLTMSVLVFRTNLQNPEQVDHVKPLLDNINGICRWNVDMQDCDHVLRIEAINISPSHIEAILQESGFFCEELED